MNSHVNVLCGFDDAYAPHFATMISSLYAASRHPQRVKLLVIKNFLHDAVRARLDRIVAGHGGAGIEWIEVDCRPFLDAPTSSHFTRAAYARIAAFDVVRAERVVYLDVDLLCCADVAGLQNIELKGRPLGAVFDPVSTFAFAGVHNSAMGMPADAAWFNSGVLVVDTKAWRKHRITALCLDILARREAVIRWVDQDLLNAAFADRWCKLPSAWNVQTCHWWPNFRAQMAAKMPEELAVARSPKIVHFNDTAKPWHLGYQHPYRQRYLEQVPRSGWPHRIQPATWNGRPDTEVEFEPVILPTAE